VQLQPLLRFGLGLYLPLSENIRVRHYKIVQLILLLAFISSCAALKDINQDEEEPLTSENVSKLGGLYKLESENRVESNFSGDHGKLYNNFKVLYTTDLEEPLHQYTVRLNVLSPKKIKLELYKNGSLMATKTRKGRIEDDYFYCRYQLFVLPFIPVIGGYRAQRQRLAIKGDTLILDFRENYWMVALIAGQWDNRQTRYYYRKIE
jgi:hypothetical protein